MECVQTSAISIKDKPYKRVSWLQKYEPWSSSGKLVCMGEVLLYKHQQ
jgi:hypothetical protein